MLPLMAAAACARAPWALLDAAQAAQASASAMSTGVLETATCELMERYRRDAGQGQPHWEGLRHVAHVQRRQALNKRRKHEALHLAAAFEPRPTAAAAPHAPATAGVGLEGRLQQDGWWLRRRRQKGLPQACT